MYSATDARAALKPSASKPAAPTGFGRSTYAKFYETAPQEIGPGHRSWLARGETFLTRYSDTEAGATLVRTTQPDEYAVLIPDPATRVEIVWEGTRIPISGYSVTFVPAGSSSIEVRTGGPVAQFFSTRSADLLALCSNSADYYPDPNVPAIVDWPEAIDGPRVRTYSLDVAPEQGRFGRIFRGTTLMVNYLDPRDGPRDSKALSPHDHDDFQQGSLALSGEYRHHLRWPWTADGTLWRDDEHEDCGSPSICFIPARVLHTSQAMGTGRNQLVDVFCPPRADFAQKPGWVLNAKDYPAPPGA